ncbi:hypothetical protein [Bradyrhizobium sp. RDM4]|uniref:hypothetical protein n=1 Tax=Bradyrhizobium sp. RDM4 TaxID=3378765 RepID=UPI0038FC6768
MAVLAAQRATLIGDSPEYFRSFIADETTKWTEVINEPGVETPKQVFTSPACGRGRRAPGDAKHRPARGG